MGIKSNRQEYFRDERFFLYGNRSMIQNRHPGGIAGSTVRHTRAAGEDSQAGMGAGCFCGIIDILSAVTLC